MVNSHYQRQLILQIGLILLMLVGLVGLTWINYRYVVNDSGMNEFISRWAATRWFLIKGMSPYSQQTNDDLQELVFGNSGGRQNGGGWYLLPFFSFLIYSPFALIGDQNIARAVWMTILETSIIGITVLGIWINRWRTAKWLFALVLLFPLIWYYSVRAILNGNIIILSTFFLSLALAGIRSNLDNFSGMMLALSMVCYPIVFPLFLFTLLWAGSVQRRALFWSSIISLVFLLIAPALFLQDWIIQFLRQVVSHGDFGMTPGGVISHWLPGVGKQTSWILTAVMAGLVVWEWISAWGKDYRWFLWTACLTLDISFLIGLPYSIEFYILLLPATIIVLATWDERWGIIGRILVIFSILLMIFGFWMIAIYAVQRGISPDVDMTLIFFPPLYLLFGLYWVKARAIRKPLLTIEESSPG